MGYSSISAQGLSAPPYIFAFIAALLSTWIADSTSQRRYTIILLSVLGTACYIILAASTTPRIRYAGGFLAAARVFPRIGNMPLWITNQRSDTRRGTGIAMVNVAGQCWHVAQCKEHVCIPRANSHIIGRGCECVRRS
jgi:hypothetical protein